MMYRIMQLSVVLPLLIAADPHTCSTMPTPEPTVTPAQLQRVVCPNIKIIKFVYEPGQPDVSDTIPTINQIRPNNAALAKICSKK